MNERKIEARVLALLVVTVAALYLCWLMLQPFVNVLAWAAVLVISFYPVHRRLVSRTRRPATSAMLSSLFVIIVILLPLLFLSLTVVNEMAGLLQNLQDGAGKLLDPNSPVVGRVTAWLGQYVNIEQLSSQQFLLDRLKGLSGTIAGSAFGFVGGLLGVIVQVFFVIFTMYYLFRDGDRIMRALPEMLPLERAQSEVIFARTKDVISASLYGVLVIATIQGALGGLAFWTLGLPSAVVWAVTMIFLSMIPMAGAFIVWVPAAIYLAATGHWVKALILVAWGVLVIGTIDNFLRPRLVGEKTKLHELFIFFSVLGGLKVFGVLGIVLGPVVLAITLALLDVFRQAERSKTSAAAADASPPEEVSTIKTETSAEHIPA